MLQTGPMANTTTLEGQLVDSVKNEQLLNTLQVQYGGGHPSSVQLLSSVPLNSLEMQPQAPLTLVSSPPSPPPSPASTGESPVVYLVLQSCRCHHVLHSVGEGPGRKIACR